MLLSVISRSVNIQTAGENKVYYFFAAPLTYNVCPFRSTLSMLPLKEVT